MMFYSKLSPGHKKSTNATSMPVAQDATCYNMDHEYRGVAVIINHDVFEGSAQSLPERSGSWKDVEELQSMFYSLDFKVVVWDNLYHDELHYRMNKCMYYDMLSIVSITKYIWIMYFNMTVFFFIFSVANEDHSDNDCLAVVVLTHGINSSFIYAKDNPYPVESLWNSFTADKCPTLAGKPKIFFIQVIFFINF